MLVLAAALAGLVAARSWTRRRRRALRRTAPDPAGKVLGAWSEVLDSLALFRVPVIQPDAIGGVRGRDRARPAGR